ncbi:MAG TPA: glycine-rich protein [Roseiarcus sp.]|nr:glycine-rich protein [Roseiarcus sp.]
MIKSRAMLLAGVSAMAMLACVAEADAEKFIFTGGEQSFPVLVSGEYSLDVLGASGGLSRNNADGLGAEVSGDISLTAGETLTLFVGGQGLNGGYVGGGGGGGGGFVLLGTSVLAVAGGGGGGL